MKNLTHKSILLLLLAVGMVFSSCDGYLEDNIATPNDPVEANPPLLLASAQVSTFATYSGQLVRQSLLFDQHLAGTDAGSQSIEVANYLITESTNINEWESIYSAITDCKLLINDFGGASPHYRGVARVVLALNIGIASDLWGDIPYTQAADAPNGGTLNPAYDDHAFIIDDIGRLLDEAIADMSVAVDANQFVPTTDDLVYGGNMDAWIMAATVLKARYANRLSEVNPGGSATEVLNILSSNSMSSSADDAFAPFPGGNGLNQWSAFESSRGGYYRANSTFVSMLVDNNDPRTAFFLGTDGAGGFSGTDSDDLGNTGSSYVGPLYGSATSPIPLISYVEQKFLEAEARLRAGGDAQGAADALNEAVMASVMQVTGAAAPQAFIDSFASEDAGSINLDKIMMQKYIALFIQIETYSDWRRTGIPALTPNGNAGCAIPLRLPIQQNERLYNSSAPSYPGTPCNILTTPVFWDE